MLAKCCQDGNCSINVESYNWTLWHQERKLALNEAKDVQEEWELGTAVANSLDILMSGKQCQDT